MATKITGQLILAASGAESSSINFAGLPTASSLDNILIYNTASGQLSYTSSAAIGGGGGTPGGSNTQVQYNVGGAFAGTASFTFIYQSQSLQQGRSVTASGLYSHAQGDNTTAVGNYSHAEGNATYALGTYAHSEGSSNAGQYGYLTEGNVVSGIITLSQSYGDVSGYLDTIVIYRDNNTSILTLLEIDLENNPPYFSNPNTIVPTTNTSFNNNNPGTLAVAFEVKPTGSDTVVGGLAAHAEGAYSFALGIHSHAEGSSTQAMGNYSHTEGQLTEARGNYSHAEGSNAQAIGNFSHAEGTSTKAIGIVSHAEGYQTLASGSFSHAEGNQTIASGSFSHAEGDNTIAIGNYSHAEGRLAFSRGSNSHAEGNQTTAIGNFSHAEGNQTTAIGSYSHAGGDNTISSGSGQTVYGSYNTQNNTGSKFIVGIGSGLSTRKDGFTVDVDANLSGSIMIPTNIGNPLNPKTGSMYYNITTNRLHIYNGTAWKSSSFS